MTPEERVAYETRVRTRQVVVAGAAGVLVISAALTQVIGPHVSVTEQTLGLITADKRLALDFVGSTLSALGAFALAWTLWYLWGCARARDANIRPSFVVWFAVAGGVIAGTGAIANAIATSVAAHRFVTQGSQTYPEARALLHKIWVVAPQIALYLGALFVAVALVMVSLNAMRVGLLTKFLGYLGIIAGVLTIIPFLPIPVVESYWLLALAYLFSGRWPSGVPPAWSSGRAERWPSRQELLAARQGQGSSRDGRAKRAPEPAPQAVGAPAPSSTRSTTPKRKRKRRK
jgi:hypothetical protein